MDCWRRVGNRANMQGSIRRAISKKIWTHVSKFHHSNCKNISISFGHEIKENNGRTRLLIFTWGFTAIKDTMHAHKRVSWLNILMYAINISGTGVKTITATNDWTSPTQVLQKKRRKINAIILDAIEVENRVVFFESIKCSSIKQYSSA